MVKVVHEELTELLSGGDHRLVPSSQTPTVLMLVGLQGSGKTTTAAKLALALRRQGHRSLLVAADLRRPAAIQQLETLGRQLDMALGYFNVEVAGSLPRPSQLLALMGGGVKRADELGFAVTGWAIVDEEVAAPLANVIALPMMFLSGVFFPRSIMPGALEAVTDFLPLTYLIDAMRSVAIDGEVLWSQGWNILGLAVWLAITFLVAVRLFRWE